MMRQRRLGASGRLPARASGHRGIHRPAGTSATGATSPSTHQLGRENQTCPIGRSVRASPGLAGCSNGDAAASITRAVGW